jgi:hypothetical protein
VKVLVATVDFRSTSQDVELEVSKGAEDYVLTAFDQIRVLRAADGRMISSRYVIQMRIVERDE